MTDRKRKEDLINELDRVKRICIQHDISQSSDVFKILQPTNDELDNKIKSMRLLELECFLDKYKDIFTSVSFTLKTSNSYETMEFIENDDSLEMYIEDDKVEYVLE